MQPIKVLPKLKTRASDSHKGDFGKVCIIGGSLGFSGAAALTAKSALRSGSGLVRVAAPKSVLPIVAAIEPCYTTIPLAEDTAGKISSKAIDAVLNAVEQNDCIAFGPGIGISPGLKTILENLIKIENLKMVIDADGLNNLANLKNWHHIHKANIVLTPHRGEMQRLWSSVFRNPLPDDRLQIANQFAMETKTVVVLKGHQTVVSDGEKFYVNTTGNPGMATAGSGDVLTGVIVSLIGQGLDNFDAAVAGVYIHGLAGDLAAKDKGQISLIAADIIDYLPAAFKAFIGEPQ